MWYIYILLCQDGSLYTGSTNDVQKRFLAHQSGKAAKYTRAHKPLKVIYQEELLTKSDALKREAEIKSWTRQQKITKLNLATDLAAVSVSQSE